MNLSNISTFSIIFHIFMNHNKMFCDNHWHRTKWTKLSPNHLLRWQASSWEITSNRTVTFSCNNDADNYSCFRFRLTDVNCLLQYIWPGFYVSHSNHVVRNFGKMRIFSTSRIFNVFKPKSYEFNQHRVQ